VADALDVDCSCFGRMLRPTSPVPDIVESIIRGGEPDGMSLEKLPKNLPLAWEEQQTE
jgi:hypothetical protein